MTDTIVIELTDELIRDTAQFLGYGDDPCLDDPAVMDCITRELAISAIEVRLSRAN